MTERDRSMLTVTLGTGDRGLRLRHAIDLAASAANMSASRWIVDVIRRELERPTPPWSEDFAALAGRIERLEKEISSCKSSA